MSIDLTQIENEILKLIATGIGLLGLYVLQRIAAKFNINISGARKQEFVAALDKSLTYGVTAAEGVIASKGWNHVDTKSAILTTAADYIVQKFPAEVKAVGLRPNVLDPTNAKALVTVLQRKLPDVVARMVVSPGTPPANAGEAGEAQMVKEGIATAKAAVAVNQAAPVASLVPPAGGIPASGVVKPTTTGGAV